MTFAGLMVHPFFVFVLTFGIQAGIAPPIHATGLETPRFRYILPEGFGGWACFDFGVEGAPPLKRDSKGFYLLEPVKNGIVPTSSFPSLQHPPFASEVMQVVNGQQQVVAFDEIQQRGAFDTKSPVARYCSFFGSAAAARSAARPPTLTESALGTAPLLQRFEFSTGSLCDFREIPRVCLDAKDVTKGRIGRAMVEGLRGHSIAASENCDAFDGIVVRYRADWALQTHGNSRGPRYAFAEVRREQRGKGTLALATWSDSDGGEPDAVAKRFDRDLAEFFRYVAVVTCAK